MKSFLLWLSLLLALPGIAQDSKEHEFLGTLELSDSSLITYKLSFKEVDEGIIEGFSITDFQGGHRTQSEIRGTYDAKEKKISFQEIGNVTTKSDAEPEEFCYVHVEDAKIKLAKGKSIIQGNFRGEFDNGKRCIDGYIYLIGADYLYKKLDKYGKALERAKKKDTTNSEQVHKADIERQLSETLISADETLKVKWFSDEITLELWDAEKVDKDKISLFLNGKCVLDNYQVAKSKKILTIPFGEEICSLTIVAESEGETPPNTTHVLLKDGDKKIPIVTNLKKGEKTLIILNKSK